mmetsp:Transcript_4155/g.13011  ORF Transcript_4155/g.13011 Transcript_4155/m.13011 type:complete len:284 (+) Transcript_4155:449-1300(+)
MDGEDRYAVLQRLGDVQNLVLGLAAGAIEAAATQPLTYAKNCLQQRVAVSLNPRVVYRGTPASMLSDGSLIGTQFWACGVLQKWLVGDGYRELTFAEEVGSAYAAGFASGVPCSVFELCMIQQQRFGGHAAATLRSTVSGACGPLGLFRGFVPSSQREAFFAVGYLGLSPRIQRVCDGFDLSPTVGAAAGSIVSGVICALITHPFDTCKSLMQGELGGPGLVETARRLQAEGGTAAFFRGYGTRAAMVCMCFFIFNETKLYLGYALFPGELSATRDGDDATRR